MHYPLREELQLLSAPPGLDGAPQWTVHDPVRNRYFTIDWVTFEILSRWALEDPARILEAVNQRTTLRVDLKDYEHVFDFLLMHELMRLPGHESVEACLSKHAQRQQHPLMWLIHNYLFFRIPLIKTDAWLDRTAKYVALFYTRGFMKLTVMALLAGLYGLYSQADVFTTTFVDMLTLQGLLAYGAALIFVKAVHELAHAYTAKRFGCRVPTMGVAFLVLMPLAYCDTNDVWKIVDKRAKVLVDTAGILAELTIAAWSILVWTLAPPGLVKTVAYVLGTTTWVNTLLINVSPFMRFDGYYALADYLGVANLHARSSALAAWQLRRLLFGVREPPPEQLPGRLAQFLIGFAAVTWVYRLAVFLSIAVLVYHFFIKLLGIVLFAIEIVWFVVLPIALELKSWYERRQDLMPPGNRTRVWIVATALAAILVVPWDLRIRDTGVLKPEYRHYVYVPESAQVVSHLPSNGLEVARGGLLVSLHSPELEKRTALSENDLRALQWRLGSAGFDSDLRHTLQSNAGLAESVVHDLQSLAALRATMNPIAPWDGNYYELLPDVQQGDWVSKGTNIGVLIKKTAWIVEGYFPEEDLPRLQLGNAGVFFPETPGRSRYHVTIASIEPSPIKVVEDSLYSSDTGGTIVTRAVNNKLVPDRPYYRVVFRVVEQGLDEPIMRGRVVVFAKPESPLSLVLRHVGAVLRRELTF